METRDAGSGIIELKIDDKADVRAPTELFREFVVTSGDKDLSDAIQTGEFEHQLRQALITHP